MNRLLVIVGIVAVLAVLAPNIAPGVLARFIPEDAPLEASAPEKAPAPLSPREVSLPADDQGHFRAEVVIQGRRIEALVDTGATLVSLTEETAARLGIHPAKSDYNRNLSTGNGVIKAASVTLDEIRVGGISVRNVEALIVPGKALPFNLLGMSYLGRLTRYEASRDRLLLVE